MTFIATANAVRYCGAKPVLAEVRLEDFNIDPDDIERRITPRTKTLLPVHQIGMPAQMDRIMAIANSRGLIVVEDAACAIGSSCKGQKIGKPLGRSVCFSFHPRKAITTGEGGMITTDDEQVANQLRLLRQHGMSVTDAARHASSKVVIEQYVRVGYNYRMTDIQAAIGIEQLRRLDKIVAKRQSLARRYTRALGKLPAVITPTVPPEVDFNYQSYAIRLAEGAKVSRDDLMQRLLDQGISTRRGIMLIHREQAYADLCSGLRLPVSEKASDSSVLLPLYPQMTRSDQDRVIAALAAALG